MTTEEYVITELLETGRFTYIYDQPNPIECILLKLLAEDRLIEIVQQDYAIILYEMVY